MALINRVARLFKADFNAVLDQIEEPEQLLRQSILDMEDELSAIEQRIALGVHEQDSLSTHRDDYQSSLDDFNSKLDICFESGKEDLARPLVRKKLEIQVILKKLGTQIDSNDRSLTELRKHLDENRETLSALRQKADLIAHSVSDDTVSIHGLDRYGCALRVGDEEIEIALLREKAKRGVA